MTFFLIIIFILFSCNNLSSSDQDNDSGDESSSYLVEEYFAYNVSNQVAFYFFNNVLINSVFIDTADWVGAFKNDICVGSQKWICGSNSCEIPIYGEYSLNQDTQGYMLPGELPSFKIYDSSENIYYDAISSDQIPWQDGIFPIIDSLITQ